MEIINVIRECKVTYIIILFCLINACSGPEETGLNKSGKSLFSEVTKQAGLSRLRDSYAHCWGDINGDSLQDIFIINHIMSPTLFRNNGDGTFSDITAASGTKRGGDLHGCAIADYDNDDDQDIYVTVGAQRGQGLGLNRLYRNNGKGKFIDVASGAGVANPKGRGRSVSWVDYNNDGYLDLYVTNKKRADAPSALFMNNANGTFSDVSLKSGIDIVDDIVESSWSDYDNDGFMDLTTLTLKRHLKGTVDIYRNLHDGKFKKVKTFNGRSFAWGDYDNDGDLDILVSSPPRVYIWKIEFDFLSKLFRGFNKLYENNGEGQFTDVSDRAGFSREAGGERAVFFDYDNDGDLDLYLLVKGTESRNINDKIFRNNGDRTFSNVTEDINFVQEFKGRGSGIAYADYNNDGFLDLFITNGSMSYISGSPEIGEVAGPYVLYQNNGNNNNWLGLRLIGTKSNRDGIGARIKIFAGEKAQYHHSNGGMEGFIQHSKIIHFGLESANRVDRIEVKWPSGEITHLSNVETNQAFTIKE